MKWFAGMVVALVGAVAGFARGAEPTAEGMEFFEKKIRPVMVERCYECHSATAKKLKGKFKLDTKEDLEKGGDSGVVIVPGDPEKSLLIKAVRWKDEDLQMPPKQKLSDGQIKDFEQWVKMGSPYPAAAKKAAVKSPEEQLAEARKFWSFVPPKQPVAPVVRPGWAKTDVDRFVQAKLEERGLTCGPMADRRTLIRRATFDLTGLPPRIEDVEAFVADQSPNAFEKVVDRLLASPQYGERWGRYWLDVSRYADSKGYVFEEERRYPYSYTYRDWVVRALNEDLPYDQFLIQQIAADQLPLEEDKRPLAAMGFLTLGRRFLNQQPDIIDDRIDVISRGTMGMTVACARCHDHKFDPIPTADYYSLYGVFASSVEPGDPPELGTAANNPEQRAAYEKELKEKEAEVEKFKVKRFGELVGGARSAKQIEASLLASLETSGGTREQFRDAATKHSVSRGMVERWHNYMKKTASGNDAVWGPWHALRGIESKEVASKGSSTIAKLAEDKSKPINPLVLAALSEKPIGSMQDAAGRYAKLIAGFDKKEKLADANEEQIRQVLYGELTPTNVSVAEADSLFGRDDQSKIRELRKKVDALKVTHPGAPAKAMVLNDAPTPVNQAIFIRGNAGNQGAAVPRQFLAILSPGKREPFKKGSGRLELAQAIASKSNPLTARVMVNRIWLGHFGVGIVRTPSDFGTRGIAPTHPELLDYLATRFMEEGWSIKKMHRLIMLSAVYQQSSEDRPSGRAIDMENTLLWRMNRRRLDFEGTRDSLLFASGQLDMTIGGRAVDLPASNRRTLYGFIDRQNLPALWRAFDFASPDTHSPQRYVTTVPQQALYLMNSPFAMEQARRLMMRKEISGVSEAEKKVGAMYRVLYSREASAEEIAMGVEFVNYEKQKGPAIPARGALTPWEKYAQVLLAGNEFVFVD
ncbi:MAG TPA: PSD1 and planctomycete cytochrome C domain-containing protein [Tepidisphaeraceae bacterium]|nr:PSD1 and planctomycete cytochrome C domain-containing protein [Tepidisphaeraceae bacterium]